MERLAVYTSIDGKILTKVINTEKFNEVNTICLKIPQGRVTLLRHNIFDKYNSMFTEVWIEPGRESVLRDYDIQEKAFSLHCVEIIYES